MNRLLDGFLRDATVRDVAIACLDILIVYYVIYRVLLAIRGTRASQMVIGIVLIGALFYAAERLEMATVSWLLDNLINYFIIIVIVVFQQDIRRGLMRLGRNVVPFGRGRELSHTLDEVIGAAEHLAKARIGAIVVFEREADLNDFVEHGGVLDARISKELLVSLFVPSRDNEFHDGAALIRNLQVHRAGVVLPLSSQPLGAQYGTRHRAALGITEETDAVSLVVSEERGEISLCFAGNIARDLEGDTLRAALLGLFSRERGASAKMLEEAQAAAAVGRAVASLAEQPETRQVSERIRQSTQRGVVEEPM